jgi:hypothetical protein
MRLRQVGPGIGGLNYAPLLKDVRRPKGPAEATLSRPHAAASGARSAIQGVWTAVMAAAKRFGQRVIEARKAQAAHLIAVQSRRLADRDGLSFDRDAIGSRYY